MHNSDFYLNFICEFGEKDKTEQQKKSKDRSIFYMEE